MSLRLKIRDLLRIPGPVELGMSKYNALGCRDLTPFQEGPTWEDYEERIRQEYPIRSFLSEVIGGWLSQKVYNLTERYREFKHRYIYRSHLIDVSHVYPERRPFDYGYRDPCDMFWVAGWKALRVYVEECQPMDPASPETGFTDEDRAEPWYQSKKDAYDEIMALYHYWMVGQLEESQESMRLFNLKKEAAKQGEEAYEAATKVWLDYYKASEDREEEMFLRLVKVRPHLWN